MILNSYNDDATVTITLDLDDLDLLDQVLELAGDVRLDHDMLLAYAIEQAQTDVRLAIDTCSATLDAEQDRPCGCPDYHLADCPIRTSRYDADDPDPDDYYDDDYYDDEEEEEVVTLRLIEPGDRAVLARYIADLIGDDESEWAV